MVDMLTRGSAQTQFTLFYGKLDPCFSPLAHWWWPKVFYFPCVLSQAWLEMEHYSREPQEVFPNKWRNKKYPSTSPCWNTIWHEHKACKEAALLCFVIHKVVAMNK